MPLPRTRSTSVVTGPTRLTPTLLTQSSGRTTRACRMATSSSTTTTPSSSGSPPPSHSGSEYACFNPYIMKVLCYSLDPSPVSPNNLGFKVAPSSVFCVQGCGPGTGYFLPIRIRKFKKVGSGLNIQFQKPCRIKLESNFFSAFFYQIYPF
mgnify:CR=1 FL=1